MRTRAPIDPTTIAWVEQTLGRGWRVEGRRRLSGGIVAVVHRLSVSRRGERRTVVLKHYDSEDHRGPGEVRNEAAILDLIGDARLLAPTLLGATSQAEPVPALLMSRVPGSAWLAPSDPIQWLEQIAARATAIHRAPVGAGPFHPWIRPDELHLRVSDGSPALWQRMQSVLALPPASIDTVFIHRDFQHFNLLWTRERLTAVVDWAAASMGPAEIDVGHCMLNLAVLFDVQTSLRFLRLYEQVSDRRCDPWWLLHAVASYSDDWRDFIPTQVDGRAKVDVGGMTARVEDLIERLVNRIDS